MASIKKVYDSIWFPLILFLIFFCIPFIIYWGLFSADKIFVSGDGVGAYSIKLFLRNSLLNGDFPLWNKYFENGVPFAADPSNGAFYPVALLLSFLGPKPYVYAYYAFHVALGSTFTYLFLKEIDCKKYVSICVSFIYAFSIHLSGYRKDHIVIIATIVYLPVILYYIEKYVRTLKVKWLLFASLAMAVQFLGSFMQDALYTDIAVFFYLLMCAPYKKTSVRKLLGDAAIWIGSYVALTCVQLLPTAQLLAEYGKSGSSGMSFDDFKTYSINFIKLSMMIFPKIFGDNVYQPFGYSNSSEMDIEIFLGVFVTVILFFGLAYFWKQKKMRVFAVMMAISFIFAANAHVPFLSVVLYHVPILGGMRVPSRVLFVFIFFAYAALGVTLTSLIDENKNPLKRLFVFVGIALTGTAALIAIMGVSAYTSKIISPTADLHALLKYASGAFPPAICVMVLAAAAALALLKLHGKKHYKNFYVIFCVFITCVTIFETFPYSGLHRESPLSDMTTGGADVAQIKRGIGNGKIWDAFPSIDAGHTSIISLSTNILKGLPAINAYIALNNPNIYKLFSNSNSAPLNSSGLMTGSINARSNVALQNDLLSMLGIKYIIDSYNLIGDSGETVSFAGRTPVYSEASVNVAPGSLSVVPFNVMVKPNTYYKIAFHAEAADSPELFYIDLYGGAPYDLSEAEYHFDIQKGAGDYSGVLFSGDTSKAEGQTTLRVVSYGEGNIDLSDFNFYELTAVPQNGAYKPFIVNDNERIFENTNAKDILYVSKNVVSVPDEDYFFRNRVGYNLANTSCVVNYKDMDFSDVNADISVDYFNNNRIKAAVDTDKAAFVNFSQNYYPGWKAYVDGKETKIYKVNGLIQGINVPAGRHQVEFVFTAPLVTAGAAVTLLTIAMIVLYLIMERRKAGLFHK